MRDRIWSTRTSTTYPRSSESKPTERILDLSPPGKARLRYVAVYPNEYALGMANLGFQTLVALLSDLPEAACHRVFADFPRSLESGRTLGEYDVVALSLSFEGDYPAALRLLEGGGVPLRSTERGRDAPLVIAGGIAPTLNPEPLASFVDVAFLGEAESGLAPLHAFLLEHRGLDRPDLLEQLAQARLPGSYVPSRYRVEESRGTVIGRQPLRGAPEIVDRVWANIPWEPARTRISTPQDAFRGAYLIEVSRGCPHACRFCAAGHIARPARFLPLRVLEPLARFGSKEVGRVGLVGAAVSDHPDLEDLAVGILQEKSEFTVSSFRVENLDFDRLRLLVRGGLQTLTVALEAGTPELRGLLGKDMDDRHLIEVARMAGEAGVLGLRIYAMVGLPGEADRDVRAIGALAAKVRSTMGRGSVTVSATPFVPKPHTPLQWAPMAAESVLRSRIRLLERECTRVKGVRAVAEAPKWARVQGFLSRGGRSAGPLLETASRNGDWRAVLRSAEAASVLDRQRPLAEVFPWDFMGMVPTREHLLRERAAGYRRAPPLPCRPGDCVTCGIC